MVFINNDDPYLFMGTLFFGIAVYNLDKIFNLFQYKLGVTNLVFKSNTVVASTNKGELSIPWIKLPCMEYDFFFFQENIDLEKNILIKEKVFKELFKYEKVYQVPRYRNGIICNIVKPSQFNNTSKITGCVRSFLDDHIYLFVIENDEYIDYKKILNTYCEQMETLETEEDDTEDELEVI